MKAIKRYFQNYFNSHMPSDRIRQEAYQEITNSLNKAFSLLSLRQYNHSLNVKGLLVKAVEMFVGSRVMPKNIGLSRQLIKIAQSKAKDERELAEIQYYKYFFLRIDGFKTGKEEEFHLSTQMINKLAEEKQHPQSCYLVGKQLVNIAANSSNQQQKKQMAKLAAHYFQKSLNENQFGGLYYLGQILRAAEHKEITQEELRQFFVYGAALGDPMCYFRLSQIYLSEGNIRLYLKYLKMAAENGIIQAQHNLGCQYLEGNRVKKDQVKALGWFLHAGANGFIQSKYNTVYMFLSGSQCGRIKKNRKAALLKLQQLKKIGEPVQKQIQQLVKSQQLNQEADSKKKLAKN